MDVTSAEVEPLWNAAFGSAERPQLFKTIGERKELFAPLNDSQSFIQDIQGMSRAKLYAVSANGQLAMKLAQDEYTAIDKVLKELTGKDGSTNPQSLKRPDVFEEEKQAALYGYKHVQVKPSLSNATIKLLEAAEPASFTDADKRDVQLSVDPFMQGGFFPTKWKSSDYQKAKLKAANPNNIDGWAPIVKDDKNLVPRANPRKPLWQEELDWIAEKKESGERRLRHADAGYDLRPDSSGSADSQKTPSRVVNKPLTRFKGRKHPPTREVSEAPSATSTPRGRRQNTPQFISTPGTPAGPGGDSNKRRRLNATPKSTTRAKTAEDVTAALISMSREEMFSRRWDANELMACVTQNHSWLNEDPAKALEWKQKILTSKFPVRTFSMFKKWAFWKSTGQAKRPRRGKDKKGGMSVPALADIEKEESEELDQEDRPPSDPYEERFGSRKRKVDDDDEGNGEDDQVAGQRFRKQIKLQIPGTAPPKQLGIGSSTPNTPTRRSGRNARRASN